MSRLNVEEIRKDFPLLHKKINNKSIIYLDSAATSQKPSAVIEGMKAFAENQYGSIHRGVYALSVEATARYDRAREAVRRFLKAGSTQEILFTRNASEALNLVSYSYGMTFVKPGDEIVLAISEHHSNLVPWQRVAKTIGARLVYLYTDSEGRIPEKEYREKITDKTRIVAIAQVSNALGVCHDLGAIIPYAHEKGAVVVVDGAQGAPHMPVDVRALDADFYVFSAHKLLGPTGIGVLYGKKKLLESMPPFLTGGDMIEYVEEQETTFAPLPEKFEAGTQNADGAVGLEAAIGYLEGVGMAAVHDYEAELTAYALERMQTLSGVRVLGPQGLDRRSGVISFELEGVHPHDIATFLDADGICVRAGHHCAQPLMTYMKVPATCRLSLYLYNTKSEIDAFIDSLNKTRKWFSNGT